MRTKEDNIILLNLSMSEMKNDKSDIIGLVVTAKDIPKEKTGDGACQKERNAQQLAITDSLTALYNAPHFQEQK
jgi:hypothetical protein